MGYVWGRRTTPPSLYYSKRAKYVAAVATKHPRSRSGRQRCVSSCEQLIGAWCGYITVSCCHQVCGSGIQFTAAVISVQVVIVVVVVVSD